MTHERIDLHTHSDRSDGTDTPTQLVEKAAAAGLDVVGLTDHDSTAGWDEAQAAADRVGIRLVKGIELSTKLRHKSVHLLAYGVDPGNAALVAEMDEVLAGRNGRVPQVLAKLRERGIEVTEDDVARESANAKASGRPHIADAMVQKGYVTDRSQAFERWLNPGMPGYVERYATDLDDAIALVVAAGGKPVLAHPWARGSDRVLTREVLERLAASGLAGIEVDHNDHDEDRRAALAQIADALGLVRTGSSDYHGTGKDASFHLGANTTDADQLARLLP